MIIMHIQMNYCTIAEVLRRASDALESNRVSKSRRTVKSLRALAAIGEDPFLCIISNRLAPVSRIFSTYHSAQLVSL
jgi:ribosomal protein L11 methylase PrmA